MKNYIILLFLLIATTQFSKAQTQNAPAVTEQVKKELAILQKADLNLTDRQISRITAVLMSQEQIEARNLKALEGNKSAIEQRLKDIKANKINNLKGALTEQQIEKFNALKLEEKF